jgi:DNA-directed RNA polymerase specialized sigma24 family protein
VRKLREDKHPDFDRLWPEMEPAVRRLSARAGRRYRIDPDEMLGQATLLLNHLLWLHDPEKGKSFMGFFVACSRRMLGEWLAQDSEFSRQLYAFQKSRDWVSVEPLTSEHANLARTDPKDKSFDAAERLGPRLWPRLTRGLKASWRELLHLRCRKGLSVKEIARRKGVTGSAISQACERAKEAARTNVSDDPDFADCWEGL